VSAPVTGARTLVVAADSAADLYVGAPGAPAVAAGAAPVARASTASSGGSGEASFTLSVAAGDFIPVRVDFQETTGVARVALRWMSPSASLPLAAVPASALYYTRAAANTPFAVKVYPGAISAGASSIEGALLAPGALLVAGEAVPLSLVVRDASGSVRTQTGGDSPAFSVEVVGVEGWAAAGRAGSSATGVPFAFSSIAGGGVALGSAPGSFVDTNVVGTVSVGSNVVTNLGGDLRASLKAGDAVIVRGQRFTVAPTAASPFTLTELPLSGPYLGAQADSGTAYTNAAVFAASAATGSYGVAFTPTIRGKYRLTVRALPTAETQVVTIDTSSQLGGTLKLAIGGVSTAPISVAATGLQVAAALAAAASPLLSGAVTVTTSLGAAQPGGGSRSTWTLAFDAADGDVPTVAVDDSGATGNDRRVSVAVATAGANAAHVAGSPALLEVVPAAVSPALSTAAGAGLSWGTAGELAGFTVQLRDAFQNDLYGYAAIAAADVVLRSDGASPLVPGVTRLAAAATPGANGTVAFTFTPTVAGGRIHGGGHRRHRGGGAKRDRDFSPHRRSHGRLYTCVPRHRVHASAVGRVRERRKDGA